MRRLDAAVTSGLLSLGLVASLDGCALDERADEARRPGADEARRPDADERRAVEGPVGDEPGSARVPDVVSTRPPRYLDLRDSMTPVKDQGDRDVCAVFAVAAEVEARVKKTRGLEIDLSEEYLIHAAKGSATPCIGYGGDFLRADCAPFFRNRAYTVSSGLDETRGWPRKETMAPSDVYEAILDGLLLEQDWAYQPSWFARGLPGEEYAAGDPNAPPECYSHDAPPPEVRARRIRATWCDELPSLERYQRRAIESDRYTVDPSVFFMAEHRAPVIACLPLPSCGWPASGDVSHDSPSLSQDEVAALAATSEEGGVHIVLLTGYDLDRRVFFFKNSWGTSWGHDGYGTVTFDLIETWFRAKGAWPCTTMGNALHELGPIPRRAPPEEPAASALAVSAARRPGQGVSIVVTGTLRGVGGRVFAVRCDLMKRTSSGAEGAEEDVVVEPDAAIHVSVPREARDARAWTQDAPLRLQVPEEVLVRAVGLAAPTPLFLRTTLAVHTDRVGYEALAQVDAPVR